MPIKRLHYFDKQFLVEKDFTDEQKYHLEMRRRLNQILYAPGIAEGLQVDRTGNKEVTVRRGMAIDIDGREIVLEADQVIDVSDSSRFKPNEEVTVTALYQEEETDESTSTVPGKTRITEKAVIQATPQGSTPPNKSVGLVIFGMDASGNVATTPFPVALGPKVRPKHALSSVNSVGGLDGNVTLTPGTGIGITPNPTIGSITVSALGPATIDGVSNPGGNIDLVPGTGISINANAATRSITIAASGPQGPVSVDGVTNPAGNIDLIQGGAITIAPDNVAKRITISETHSALTNNPHNVTAAQIGALLAQDYDLNLRATPSIAFTQADASGAQRTVNLNFSPRLIFVVGTWAASMSGRTYSGVVQACASIRANLTIQGQNHCSSAVTRNSNADWFMRGITGNAICDTTLSNNETTPTQGERLLINITAATDNGFTATLTRTTTNASPLPNFTITLQLLCLGTLPVI